MNQIYNISSAQNITLKKIHEQVFDFLKPPHCELKFSDIWAQDEKSKNTYPSVHCGPISNSKLIETFKPFSFTPQKSSLSIEQSAKFFKDSMKISFSNKIFTVICPFSDQIGNFYVSK